MNGPLGYELDILSASDTAKTTMHKQILEYRSYEHLILRGDFYRLLNPFECGCYAYYFASDDSRELLVSFLQNLIFPTKTLHFVGLSIAQSGNAEFVLLDSCQASINTTATAKSDDCNGKLCLHDWLLSPKRGL
jgi:alpha-galactosidase